MIEGKSRGVSIGAGAASWSLLAAAVALLLFANGRSTLGLTAWLAPIVLVRFVRTRPARAGVPAAYAALSLAWAFQFRGMVPLPPLGYVALALGFGAIEQGFNMVRQVNRGLSVAADYQGRVVAAMDHFATEDRDLVAQVPTRGVRTLYSRIGDAFAWACAAGALVLIALAARRRG